MFATAAGPLLFAALPLLARAQTRLVDRRFTYDALPYQADTDGGIRGPQYGYNRCNATTEGPTSRCQTGYLNSVEDWCVWGPPDPNSVVGNTEGEAVAWCTKAGHGTRIIPNGAIKGVHFVKTPSYVQVTGMIDQTLINMQAADFGGEMDPHGADNRGNPIGGLVFSNAFTGAYAQVIEWHNFMGANTFCFKACDPRSADGPRMCEHVYDRIGCAYNAPANYAANVFESCAGDNQDPPGVYTVNGVASTYQQPPESLGPISVVPYTPRTPASSLCQTVNSALVFTAGSTSTTSTSTSSSSSATTTGSPSTSATLVPTASISGGSNGSNGAGSLVVSGGLSLLAAAGVAAMVAALW